MYKDKNAQECKKYLSDKNCAVCNKFLNDCERESGIYLYFKNKSQGLLNISKVKNYVKPATAIIRTFPVCRKHFKIIKRDNDIRQRSGIEILADLELLNYRRSFL